MSVIMADGPPPFDAALVARLNIDIELIQRADQAVASGFNAQGFGEEDRARLYLVVRKLEDNYDGRWDSILPEADSNLDAILDMRKSLGLMTPSEDVGMDINHWLSVIYESLISRYIFSIDIKLILYSLNNLIDKDFNKLSIISRAILSAVPNNNVEYPRDLMDPSKLNPILLKPDLHERFAKSLEGALLALGDGGESLLDFLEGISNPHPVELALPETAPETYVPRGQEKSGDFLRRVYGSYLEAGVLYQPDVRRLDPSLMQALNNEFRGRRDELRALIPTKQDQTQRRLREAAMRPVGSEARERLLATLRR